MRNKFNAIKTTIEGITFDSKREARRWQELKLLERAGEIERLERQVPFSLVVEGQKIATWKSNKDSRTTDWKAAFSDLCITANVGELCGQMIERHTTTRPGARPLLIK